ncbi:MULTISPECIES: RHS repeat-associated core domain-containing protein [unclassified Dyella]|uniref:RHS repeat domain-containing protein n=1 Tax=unclassified Dyella TaxID=2634549 RepID=UPI0013043D76|nr:MULTISPECIES: RHS repeat-associated core domain-containing protein [unclassified Dyella]MDR3445449.1 RHS repeat-associated core domain-containing protein [Dyella sp.]
MTVNEPIRVAGGFQCDEEIDLVVTVDGNWLDVDVGRNTFSGTVIINTPGTHVVELSAMIVSGVPTQRVTFQVSAPPAGSISASPSVCNIAPGGSVCTSVINWNANRTFTGVWVTDLANRNPQKFADAGKTFNGSATAPWISSSGTRFHLKENAFGAYENQPDLATVDVRGNWAPDVALTSPVATSTFYNTPSSVKLSANASDRDGSIQRVDFWVDGSKVASITSSPYQTTWFNGSEGFHQAQAYAFDNLGNYTWTDPASFTIVNSRINGNIDSVSREGIINGWACSTSIAQSINVHLYLGGPAGTGTFVGSYPANQASEPGVASACKVGGGSYRFAIALTEAQLVQWSGKSIYIYGISPVSGNSNDLVGKSGSFVVPAPYPDAQFVGQNVPGTMYGGQTQSISLQFKNTGTLTWSREANYKLGSQNPSDNAVWGAGRLLLPNDVAPGQTVTVQASLKVPMANGTYNFQWRMLQEGVTWFGEASSNVAVNVGPPPPPPPPPTNPQTRRYVYDANQLLCKVIEPETGATVMEYDAAGNLAWSASGLDLPDAGNCNRGEAFASARMVARLYDERDRLKTLSFPDRNGDQDWTYWPDGLPKSVTTQNEAGASQVTNTYGYNRRRTLTGESLSQPNTYNWTIAYAIDAYGNPAGYTTPDGLQVSYAVNALGQPTGISSQLGTYASNISYYPNGAIKQFNYGNGILHQMAQNLRQLPLRSVDGNVLDLETAYDANGNVDTIYDRIQGAGYDRYMGYDGLDRLYRACSPMFGGDSCHRFTYDPLDNLRGWQLSGVKDYANYNYDGRNRLTSIQNSGGAALVALGYDAQGNLASKNSVLYQFDVGNRLRSVPGIESYRYDGEGRRIQSEVPILGSKLSFYGKDGRLIFGQDQWRQINTSYVYLGKHLLATVESNYTTHANQVKFQHTDALGSPVAVTDATGKVIERTNWEPYGVALSKPSYDGVGYAGHVMDGSTGLSYMQQRYYDPQVGRFLSMDPVSAGAVSFNRYSYANNNPYRFVDPDGRYACGSSDTTTCNQITQFVNTMNSALSRLQKGSDAYSRLSAVSAHIGKLGDNNGLTLNAGALSKNTIAVANSATTMTIDVKQASTLSAPFRQYNPGVPAGKLANAFGAGAVAHEGQHQLDFKASGYPDGRTKEYATELNAYRTELGVPKGLGLSTDLYAPGALPKDIDSRVREAASASTNLWCRDNGC